MKETLLEKINKIEEVKANYEGKTFNAGLIDSIFSGVSRVRKEADGNEFECKYCAYVGTTKFDFIEFKALIQYKGTILKQRTTLCPFTNQPLYTKVKQYCVKEFKIADGIDSFINRLEEEKSWLTECYNNVKEYIDNTPYEKYVILNAITSNIYGYDKKCLSIKELQEYLSKALNNVDGNRVIINRNIIMKLINANQISLRLARYLERYLTKQRANQFVFQFYDLNSEYNKMINYEKECCQDLMERINSIKEEIKEWEVVKGLYS